MSKKRIYRDIIRFCGAIIFSWLYVPHFIFYYVNGGKNSLISLDVKRTLSDNFIRFGDKMELLYLLHTDRYFRCLFYHRIGPIASFFVVWYRPGDRYFIISKSTKIGGGAVMTHPFSTIINAKSIGENFTCRNCTTLGNKVDGRNDLRPTIGDNVILGVNVNIIGNVIIGNNVTIGAGSVVVKDIPDNCVAVGNPCKPIKFIQPNDGC